MGEGFWSLEMPGEGLLPDIWELQPAIALLVQIQQRDLSLAWHCHRVANLATRLARGIGLNHDEARTIRWAALLHDVGKLRISDTILNKSGPLNQDEWAIVRRHPVEGAEMVNTLTGMREVADLILTHHERYNGLGYPYRLPQDQIPIGARILAVTDSYCAMTDKRIYRLSSTPAQARNELLRCTHIDFDPDVVHAFLEIVP